MKKYKKFSLKFFILNRIFIQNNIMIATNPRLKRFSTLDTKNNTDPITNSKISHINIICSFCFHDIFSLPVCIENDANCAGLGEALMGSGKDYNSVIFRTLEKIIKAVGYSSFRRGVSGSFGICTLRKKCKNTFVTHSCKA